MSDPYAATAPYYGLMANSFWTSLGPALADALGGTNAAGGPVIDIGAGTGRSTMVIADALPDAEVWAVEPSLSMRAMLMGHLALRPEWHDRVSVVASGIDELVWPDRVAAMVACNMIGHLDADARTALWARTVEHLAPGGVAVVGLQPPARPQRLPRTMMNSTRLGRHTYEGQAEGEPSGDRSVHWTMTYQTKRDGIVVDEVVNTFDWWTVSREDVTAEAEAVGLAVTTGQQDLLLLRRR